MHSIKNSKVCIQHDSLTAHFKDSLHNGFYEDGRAYV
jgi:hypothetical protein